MKTDPNLTAEPQSPARLPPAPGSAIRPLSASFQVEVEKLINKCCMENGSDTPDFILAEYLSECLAAYDKAVTHRERWYGRKTAPAADSPND
jgi:hypothetical protein